MTQATDGQLHWGVPIEEGAELPWDEDYRHDPDAWWLVVTGYEPPFNPYTEDGEYAPGFSKNDPRLDDYYKSKRDWLTTHALPFKIVNVCSDAHPIYFLAVPSEGYVANRGYPVKIEPRELIVRFDDKQKLKHFCIDWKIPHDETAFGWYLSSYCG